MALSRPTPDHPGTPYLYAESFPGGPRAKFVAFDQGPVAAETPSKWFPLILNTGRVLYHWHDGTITLRVEGLMASAPELEVYMNPLDGEGFGVSDGEWVRLRSRRGEMEGRAAFTERMLQGDVFVPFVRLAESARQLPDERCLRPRLQDTRVQGLRRPRREAGDRGGVHLTGYNQEGAWTGRLEVRSARLHYRRLKGREYRDAARRQVQEDGEEVEPSSSHSH